MFVCSFIFISLWIAILCLVSTMKKIVFSYYLVLTEKELNAANNILGSNLKLNR